MAALIAAMLVYLFSSLAIRAVGKTASAIIVEVRRQFREIPGIMDYTGRPDYARVVDITTRAALREMMLPGIVAVATPIIVGLLLGYRGRGRAADGRHDRRRPARHRPEQRRRRVGQRQEVHRSPGTSWTRMARSSARSRWRTRPAVVGDTVGDPFKDTAGPSLHVLVKLLATITLVMAPLFIR